MDAAGSRGQPDPLVNGHHQWVVNKLEAALPSPLPTTTEAGVGKRQKDF
jgi:hypothetical protein